MNENPTLEQVQNSYYRKILKGVLTEIQNLGITRVKENKKTAYTLCLHTIKRTINSRLRSKKCLLQSEFDELVYDIEKIIYPPKYISASNILTYLLIDCMTYDELQSVKGVITILQNHCDHKYYQKYTLFIATNYANHTIFSQQKRL